MKKYDNTQVMCSCQSKSAKSLEAGKTNSTYNFKQILDSWDQNNKSPMDEKYDELCRAILNGRLDLSNVPRDMRLNNSSLYIYAYRFARGCPTPNKCIESIHTLLQNDITQCPDKTMAASLYRLLSDMKEFSQGTA